METTGSRRRFSPATVISMVALFISIGGTALALPGRNTVNSRDIINGQVKAADVRTNAVKEAEIDSGAVGSDEVIDETLAANDLAADSVTSSEITAGAVGSSEASDNSLTSSDLAPDSVFGSEIATGVVGSSELGASSVRASELGDGIVERAGTAVNVPGGAAENGAYTVESATASCGAGEELISAIGRWTPDDNASGDHELWIAEIRPNFANESVIVDGGNDSGVNHSIQAVAICLVT